MVSTNPMIEEQTKTAIDKAMDCLEQQAKSDSANPVINVNLSFYEMTEGSLLKSASKQIWELWMMKIVVKKNMDVHHWKENISEMVR